MRLTATTRRAVRIIPLVAVLAAAGGCTSAISTAYLRDALWEVSDHAAEEAAEADDSAVVAEDGSAGAAVTATDAAIAVSGELDAERRKAAVEEAVARLAKVGRLDAATEAALVQTLQQTAPEDWPVVVDTFAESLAVTAAATPAVTVEATAIPATNTADSAPPATAVATVADDVSPDPAFLEPPAPEPDSPALEAPEPVAPSPPEATAAPDAARDSRAAAAPDLTVRHACFAKRVQGWGMVDRFPDSRFAAGQDVIVYVELDNLSAGESPAGHTTCVDARLRLIDSEGRTVHEWTFEPVVETCPTRRHDYFARYVIRIPDAAPLGGCRLALQVVDTLAGRTASTDLPLEVVSRQVAAR